MLPEILSIFLRYLLIGAALCTGALTAAGYFLYLAGL